MTINYASQKDTINTLIQLGFIPIENHDDDTCCEIDPIFFDSKGIDPIYNLPIIQVYIYQCPYAYWCVDVDNGFMAPIVWSGPREWWNNLDYLQCFTNWLDEHYPGWKGD